MEHAAHDHETLTMLTSDIVAAHVSNNNVTVEGMQSLITNVFTALAGLGDEAIQEEPPREPAVSIRASVKPDYLVCLDCGRKLKVLKRHIATDHALSIGEYRQRWSLAADYPMVAPNYAEKRSELAKKIGLGRKPGQKRLATPVAPVPAAAAAPRTKAKAKAGPKPKPAAKPQAKAADQDKTETSSTPAQSKAKRGGTLGVKFSEVNSAPTAPQNEG